MISKGFVSKLKNRCVRTIETLFTFYSWYKCKISITLSHTYRTIFKSDKKLIQNSRGEYKTRRNSTLRVGRVRPLVSKNTKGNRSSTSERNRSSAHKIMILSRGTRREKEIHCSSPFSPNTYAEHTNMSFKSI